MSIGRDRLGPPVVTIRARVERTQIRSILLIALVLRLSLAPFFGHPGDVADLWYYGFTLFDLGIDPLPLFNQYGPGPIILVYLYYWPYTLISTRVFFALACKIPLILMEVVMVYCLFLFTRSRMKSLFLALSPVSLAATAFHGQIDAVIPFLLLITLLLLNRSRFEMSAFFLGIAAGFKYIVIPLLPIFLLLVWRMSIKTGTRRHFARFTAVLLLVDCLLYLPMLLDYAGQPLVLAVLGSPFASTGVGTWRGASMNIWEYLRLDLGVVPPGFFVLFVPFLLFGLVLSIFMVKSEVNSIIPPLVIMILGFYLLYPTIHMQNLMWALPFIYILDRKWILALFYNVSFLPRLLSRSLEGYVLEDVRALLSMTNPDATNLTLMTFGYFWFTIIIASLLVLMLRTGMKPPSLQNALLPCSERGRPRLPLTACFLVAILAIATIAALIPSQPYETANRWLYDDTRMSTRHILIPAYDVNGSVELNLPVDDSFFTGYVRDGSSCVLTLTSSIPSQVTILFNNDVVFDSNVSRVTIEIPIVLVQVHNNLTVVAEQWTVDRTDFYILFDISSLPALYTVYPGTLVTAAAIALLMFLAGETIVRKIVCGA